MEGQRHSRGNGSLRKLRWLIGSHGVAAASGVVASVLDDQYIRAFDRLHGVRTSGHIDLEATSLGIGSKGRGHRYRPVNAWAFRRFMGTLEVPPDSYFVDLGSGLGRACLLAARMECFGRVRGVEFVPEFCEVARSNASKFQVAYPAGRPIEIMQADAVDYVSGSDDNFVFMFNPFPVTLLRQVAEAIIGAAARAGRATLVVYSERLMETSATLECLRTTSGLFPVKSFHCWGQSFHLFSTVDRPSR